MRHGDLFLYNRKKQLSPLNIDRNIEGAGGDVVRNSLIAKKRMPLSSDLSLPIVCGRSSACSCFFCSRKKAMKHPQLIGQSEEKNAVLYPCRYAYVRTIIVGKIQIYQLLEGKR